MFIVLSFSLNSRVYSLLYAPFVVILITEYFDTQIIGSSNITITSLLPSLYSCCLYCNMYFVFVSFCILLMLIYGLFSGFPVSRAGKTNSIAGKIYNLTIVRFLPYIPKQA